MFLFNLLIAFIIAAVLTGIFGKGVQKREWGASLFIFFFILFASTWAGGIWITPIGIPIMGVYWLSYLVVGFFIALILTAAFLADYPYYKNYSKRHKDKQTVIKMEPEEMEEVKVLGIFFWLLIILLIISIITYYI